MLALIATNSRRYFVAGLFTGILALLRGEGLLMLPILAVAAFLHALPTTAPWYSWGRLVPAGRIAAGFACLWLPWSAYAWTVFGRVLPNTLEAKIAQSAEAAARGLRFHEVLGAKIGDGFNWAPLLSPAIGAGMLLLFWTCVGAAVVWIAARNRQLLPLLVWGVAYCVGYSLLGVPGYYDWYFVQPAWSLSVCFGVGLGLLAYRMAEFRPIRGPRLLLPVALFVTAIVAWRSFVIVDHNLRYSVSGYRDIPYLPLARWLNANAKAGEQVAAGEIGYLGYYADLQVIDLCGLVEPRFAELGGMDGVMAYYRPEYLVGFPAMERHALSETKKIGSLEYVLIETFPTVLPERLIPLYARTTDQENPS